MEDRVIHFSEYIPTFKEYEAYCLEYIGIFGYLCHYGSDLHGGVFESKYNLPDTVRINVGTPLCGEGMESFFNAKVVYADWMNVRFEHDWVDHDDWAEFYPDDPDSSMHFTRFECEQIVSILSSEYAVSVADSGYSFLGSSGVNFVRDTYFKYDAKCFDPIVVLRDRSRGEICLERRCFTYLGWVRWITGAITKFETELRSLELLESRQWDKVKLVQSISVVDGNRNHRASFPFSAFTPRTFPLFLEELKAILEADADPDETRSRESAKEFVYKVFAHTQLSSFPISREKPPHVIWESELYAIIDQVQKFYPESFVFKTKKWVCERAGVTRAFLREL